MDLKQIREKNGISLTQAAIALNVDEREMRKIESDRKPTDLELAKLSRLYEVQLHD